MKELFQNKYIVGSHRMAGWDYAGNGIYFITIVTQNRICLLGDIKNGEMVLSDFGIIVEMEWKNSFHIRTELVLHQSVIMPNHIHAIVELKLHDGSRDSNGSQGSPDSNGMTGSHVETHGRASLQSTAERPTQSTNKLQRKPKSISSFLAGFKSATTTKIDDYIDNNLLVIPKFNRNNRFWQTNYHDHIIRDEPEYQRIRQYIINNPQNWNDDQLRG